MKPIFSRGPSLQLRLFLAITVSIGLIAVDNRSSSFKQVRAYMESSMSPLIMLANMPSISLDKISDSLISRSKLQEENQALREQLLIKNSELLITEHLKQENAHLRSLLGSPVRYEEYKKAVTQVLSTDTDPYRDQVVINKGSSSGVYEGQPVINEKGVVGQVVSVAQTTSRVLLLCDSQHAIPVQVRRNDVRVIALGNGCLDDLQLEYLPLNADIQVGDELVTSGLGGHFPEGYPVAVVSSVITDRQRARTLIYATPIVNVKRLRYLLLLWTNESPSVAQPKSSSDLIPESSSTTQNQNTNEDTGNN